MEQEEEASTSATRKESRKPRKTTGTGAIVGEEDDVPDADPEIVPTACEKKKRANNG